MLSSSTRAALPFLEGGGYLAGIYGIIINFYNCNCNFPMTPMDILPGSETLLLPLIPSIIKTSPPHHPDRIVNYALES